MPSAEPPPPIVLSTDLLGRYAWHGLPMPQEHRQWCLNELRTCGMPEHGLWLMAREEDAALAENVLYLWEALRSDEGGAGMG